MELSSGLSMELSMRVVKLDFGKFSIQKHQKRRCGVSHDLESPIMAMGDQMDACGGHPTKLGDSRSWLAALREFAVRLNGAFSTQYKSFQSAVTR